MKLDIPDNIEDLEKIFKETEEETPFDFSRYLKEPIGRIIWKFGDSFLRLRYLCEKKAPDYMIKNEVEIACRYKRVLIVRGDEYIDHIHKVNSGSPLTNDYIGENAHIICMHIVKQEKKRLQEKKDQVPPLSDKEIKEINDYLMSIAFTRDNAPEPEWFWNHPEFPFIHAEIRVYTEDKDVAIHVADDVTEWSDFIVIPFEDFNQPYFEQEFEECFKTLREKVKGHLKP